MNLKQFNVKQAERWLQKLKNENLQSYKDITKFLRKYERTEDQYDCYVKISHTLLAHTDLTKEINFFLEDGNKFVVTRPEDEKLREFLGYVKKQKPDVFNDIIYMIQELSKSKGEGNTDVNKLIMPKLKEIVMGDPELQKLRDDLDMTNEELIRRQNIDHLKVNRVFVQLPQDQKEAPASQSVVTAKQRKTPLPEPRITINHAEEKRERSVRLPPPPVASNLTNISEERIALKQLQKSLDYQTFTNIVKLIRIYCLNLITKKETIDMLTTAGLEDNHFQNLKEILDTRELDRRKTSYFKPLSDINFSSYERASPSYVTFPFFYPVRSSGKTDAIRLITNDKWISVPYGSEQSQNFSVRNKNTNQINLLKAEDERYEYDLFLKRIVKTREFLDRFIAGYSAEDQSAGYRLLKKIVDLGIIQFLYRSGRDDHKDELQMYFTNYPYETCKIFRDRLHTQIIQLKSIREIHAYKSWNETALKNFYKALDLKGFQFKKNEKEKMKNTFFLSQLTERNKIVSNGGQLKPTTLCFDQKKQFFTILNSFEVSSRTQKCSSRDYPPFEKFDLKDESRRNFYPVQIMAFEDQALCQQIYSLLIFYVESATITEAQKFRCKIILEQYLIGFMGWKPPMKKTLTQFFNQELLYQKLANDTVSFDYENCFGQESEVLINKKIGDTVEARKNSEDKKSMRVDPETESKYSYLPKRQTSHSVLYTSEHVYCLTRYLYAIYERLIKMREVAQSQEKIKLFQILFYSSIKAKEGIKFEQNLNCLFGKYAYLFSTIYKLFDSLIKSIVMSSNCLLTINSFRFAEQQLSDQLYLLLVNRFCLLNSLMNNKIIRLTYNKQNRVLYVNSLDCYYKTDDLSKDMIKKRGQISRGVELFSTDDYGVNGKKKIKIDEYYQVNGLQYTFESSTIKMNNHGSNQDLLIKKNQMDAQKMLEADVKKALVFCKRSH